MGICCMPQETQTGVCINVEGWDWEGGSKGKGYMSTYGWFALKFDRKQQNFVKQFNFVQSLSRVWFCDPMDCSTPGLPVHHQITEFTQTHIHRVNDTINHLILCHPLLLHLQSFPGSRYFPMSQLFTSGDQSIGISASTSVLPMNTQDWCPLGWTGWISLQSKGLSRVFSKTTIQKHQFFGAQLSL